jgi:hypothetical protein
LDDHYASSQFQISSSYLPPALDSSTYTFWIYTCVNDNGDYILARRYDTLLYGISSYYRVYFYHDNGNYYYFQSNAVKRSNYWEYVGISRNLLPLNDNIVISTYEYSGASHRSTLTNDFSSENLFLGSNYDGTNNVPGCTCIKELAIFDQYKSLSALKALKFRSYTGNEDSLYAYFKMDGLYYEDYVYEHKTGDSIWVRGGNYGTDRYWIRDNLKYVQPPHKRTDGEVYTVDVGALLVKNVPSSPLELYAPDLLLIAEFSFQVIFKLSGARTGELKLFTNTDVFDVGINTDNTIFIRVTNTDLLLEVDWATEYLVEEDVFNELTIVKDPETVKLYMNAELQETFDLVF